MPELDVKGKKIALNQEGFLQNPDEWDDDVAEALAKAEEEIEDMSEDHWKKILHRWCVKSVKTPDFL